MNLLLKSPHTQPKDVESVKLTRHPECEVKKMRRIINKVENPTDHGFNSTDQHPQLNNREIDSNGICSDPPDIEHSISIVTTGNVVFENEHGNCFHKSISNLTDILFDDDKSQATNHIPPIHDFLFSFEGGTSNALHSYDSSKCCVSEMTYDRVNPLLRVPDQLMHEMPSQQPQQIGYPHNHHDLALITCFCCFSPLGLIAVITSGQTKIKIAEGDLESAKKYSKATIILSVLGICITIILVIVIVSTVPFSSV